MLGVVTNNNDPEDMGRVRVQFPALGDDTESAWARVATTSAGNERGLLMLPVVGEEVLVGFEHGDTTRPYVLGSLFNGKDMPGDDLLHDKDGSFVVRSDETIHTESKEAYTVKSGGTLTVEIAGKVEETYDRRLDEQDDRQGLADGDPAVRDRGSEREREGQDRGHDRGHGVADAEVRRRRRSSSRAAGVKISGPMINLG